jgi:hypothetical protein
VWHKDFSDVGPPLREPQGSELRDEVEEKEILVTAGPGGVNLASFSLSDFKVCFFLIDNLGFSSLT